MSYLWQTHLGSPPQGLHYPDTARPGLLELFSSPRRFVLEIGCATGALGAYLKQQQPKVTYWGIEPHQHAAEIAKTRLDHVLIGMTSDFDLLQEGINHGQIDGVIIADVIEHMYNPWSVLTDLKPYLSEDAEIITSIPNVRNLWLLNHISQGRFSYQDQGLLDITHIRFFTLREIQQMMHECSFIIDHLQYAIDPRLVDIFKLYQYNLPCALRYESITINNVPDVESLKEFCSLQFYSRAKLSSQM